MTGLPPKCGQDQWALDGGAFTPDRRTMLAWTYCGSVAVYDIAQRRLAFAFRNVEGPVHGAISPDSRFFAMSARCPCVGRAAGRF